MTPPPKYPRIAHLVSRPGVGGDDLVLSPEVRAQVLQVPVLVEEKLDGANVTVWLENGVPTVATRGGVDSVDRAGVRGRLRAWAATQADQLARGLGASYVLYAEWLLLRHTVRYDRLPGPLIGIDLLRSGTREFLPPRERDTRLLECEVQPPPGRPIERLGTVEAAAALIGRSAFSGGTAEGIVIRPLAPAPDLPRAVKLVRADWQPSSDADWVQDGRAPNVVVG